MGSGAIQRPCLAGVGNGTYAFQPLNHRLWRGTGRQSCPCLAAVLLRWPWGRGPRGRVTQVSPSPGPAGLALIGTLSARGDSTDRDTLLSPGHPRPGPGLEPVIPRRSNLRPASQESRAPALPTASSAIPAQGNNGGGGEGDALRLSSVFQWHVREWSPLERENARLWGGSGPWNQEVLI